MALTIKQAIATQVSLAYLGRPQDVGALTTFSFGMTAEATPSPTAAQLAALFATTESKSIFGVSATMSSVVSKSFELVGRVATAQNLTDILTWANDSKLDISQLPWEILKIAMATESQLPQASQVVWARLSVAYQLAEDISGSATALQSLATSTTQQGALRDVISGVTSFATIATAYPATGSGTAANFVSGSASSSGQTFTLTTGSNLFTGTTGNDTFDAGLSTGSLQTLNSGDRLDGGAGGADELFAVINSSVTPTSMVSIENVVLTNITTAAIVDLTNATGMVNVTNQASTVGMTLTGISRVANVTVRDTSTAGQVVIFNDVTGSADAATINLANVIGAATLTAAGVETLTLNSSGSTTNVLAGLTTANTTTLVVAGTQGLNAGTLGTTITKVDASTNTGLLAGLTAVMGNTGSNLTVIGGAGNDTITLGSAAGADNVSTGAGNDTIIYTANFTVADTIDGGAGVDTLRTTSADLVTVSAATPTTFTVTNIETIQATTTVANGVSITPANISATATRLNLAFTGGDITAATGTVVGPAGSFTLGLGGSAAGNTDGQLAAASTLTITDTGTAITDSLTIINSAINSTTALNINVFDSAVLAINGYETVTINSGSTAGGAEQVIGAITITGDVGGTSAETLILAGANAVSIAGGGGLDIINASALTATTGTLGFTFQMAAGVGTSITGSAGNDLLQSSTTLSSSVNGGAGNDSIVGSSGNDTLLGGDGNDTINGAAGNDFIDGGAGNDRVNIATTTLTFADTIIGGAGIDTLAFAALVDADNSAAVLQGISGFEILEITAAATRTLAMSNFINNQGFTRIDVAHQGDVALVIQNASASLTDIRLELGAAGDSLTFTRLLDTTTNALTVTSVGDLDTAADFGTLSVVDEETLTLSSSAAANHLKITALTATDLTTLNITGAANIFIEGIVAGSRVATVNAETATGNTKVLLTNNIVAATMTGGSGADEFTGGLLADLISTGAGNDTIIGGAGADTINAGAGDDRVAGGLGADVINVGSGTDTIVMVGGESADLGTTAITVTALAITGVDVITGIAAGDRITFSTSSAQAFDGVDAVTVGKIATAALTTTLFVDNSANLIRGSFVAGSTTGAGTFIADVLGSDTLYVVDLDPVVGTRDFEGVVLVGTSGVTGNHAHVNGVITLTLA